MTNKVKQFFFPLITGVIVVLTYLIFPFFFKDQELATYIFNITRLILLLFIFFSLYFYFTDQLEFKGDIQKIFFRGTILSVLFAGFTSLGFFAAYLAQEQQVLEGYSLFQSWFVQFTKFIKFGLIYTVMCLAWIYFHPHNLLRKRSNKGK